MLKQHFSKALTHSFQLGAPLQEGDSGLVLITFQGYYVAN
jgi:hypothetical protein